MLKDKIKGNLKEALKKGEELKLSVLRLLVGSIEAKEKQKRFSISQSQKEGVSGSDVGSQNFLSEEEITEVISSEAKKRKESIKSFRAGGREDLATKEEEELKILSDYLPKEMSDEEIEASVIKMIGEIKASGPEDMGKVMAVVIAELKGRADGSKVSEIVKKTLNKK